MFPLKYMNVTQGVDGSYSHKGSYAIDFGHRGYKEKVYAPFTGVIKQISLNNGNAVYLESVDKVLWADMTVDYMTVMFMHDDDVSNLSVGQVIKQNEVFYEQGTAGWATGIHVHIEVGKGKFRDNGWSRNGLGTFMINDAVHPVKAFFIDDAIEISKDGGYKWVKLMGNPINRNETIRQIEVLVDDLRCRLTPNGQILGFINRGMYNILDAKQEEDYLWVLVEEDHWIAHSEEWSKLYPIEADDIMDKITNLEQENKLLKDKIKLLEENNYKFSYKCIKDGRYIIKLNKDEILYIN